MESGIGISKGNVIESEMDYGIFNRRANNSSKVHLFFF